MPHGVTARAIMPEADPPFYPDGRIFVCSRGTGLDPKFGIEHLANHVQTLPEIHERFVDAFTMRPGFGFDFQAKLSRLWLNVSGSAERCT
jgi:hypothetical protein